MVMQFRPFLVELLPECYYFLFVLSIAGVLLAIQLLCDQGGILHDVLSKLLVRLFDVVFLQLANVSSDALLQLLQAVGSMISQCLRAIGLQGSFFSLACVQKKVFFRFRELP